MPHEIKYLYSIMLKYGAEIERQTDTFCARCTVDEMTHIVEFAITDTIEIVGINAWHNIISTEMTNGYKLGEK